MSRGSTRFQPADLDIIQRDSLSLALGPLGAYEIVSAIGAGVSGGKLGGDVEADETFIEKFSQPFV